METILITVFIYFAYVAFAARRLLVYLHAYQQEEYDGLRLVRWMARYGVFDKWVSLIMIGAGAAWLLAGDMPLIANIIVFGGFALGLARDKDPRRHAKKKLAMTSRAKRIYMLALIGGALPGLLIFMTALPLIWIPLIHALPFLLILANNLLQPFENSVQKGFWDEAHDKIGALPVKTIGITGSFGKTSIKHILGHILGMTAPTLMTPGSVNTPMGVARIIREYLNENHKYFICEMGAYGPGSIERLCRLAPPDLGIISTIGHAHYERYKTLDAVAYTKYEMAQATIAKGGKVIIGDKTLKFSHSRSMVSQNPNSYISVGEDENSEIRIKKISQSARGLEVRIVHDGDKYTLKAPIYGLHHGENIAIAFAAALTLNIDPENIMTALKSLPQISHRLEVKPQGPGGGILIDDAYNSNPHGFRAALDTMNVLGREKRKILITPGMVELGAAHDDLHRTLGIYAASKCDIAIVITPRRIPTFIAGFEEAKRVDQEILRMKSFAEAEKWLMKNMGKGDIALLENDLPDIYESPPKI